MDVGLVAFLLFWVQVEVDVAAWEEHVVELSHDAMEGRAPGTPGGEKAANYVAARFEAIGLEPGGDSGYHQLVPLQSGKHAANVVGLLAGTDPLSGALVLTAHYDAYGVGEPDATGDAIYNGALDNACGVAALIELGATFAGRESALARTLVFIATTAEETGSLGLEVYAARPAVVLEDTLVNINVDGINTIGATEDFIVFPSEGTETKAALEHIGERVGMTLSAEPWQSGMHFAFDTRVFLRRGIVGLTLWQGSRYRDLSSEEIATRRARFGRIHTPADEWPDWFDPGAVEQHLLLYVAAIEHFAQSPRPGLSATHPFER